MKYITVDLSQPVGKMKPMHAVNNGPISSFRGLGTMQAFSDAGIPCCRNHDASYLAAYGGSHGHDVLNIFPNFDADETDPANYDFTLTDETVRDIYACGSTMLYRLGSRIELESKKYHTYPPKDFKKYARICEHIIRHYCYGWADGMELPIIYWEIWNEADGYHADGSNNCWQGTHGEFLEFYEVMAKHLKGCFPELKIGGPAYTGSHDRWNYLEDFIKYAEAHQIPLDFFSWHGYRVDPHVYAEDINRVKGLLMNHGFMHTETILDEWNYVRGWRDEDMRYTLNTITNEKGGAFCAASMMVAQASPLDMFMYYDARPATGWNGLFTPFTYERQKPYYAFWQFNKLYQLGTSVFSSSDCRDIYVCAASNNEKSAIQLAYYAENDLPDDTVEITIKGLRDSVEVTTYLTDAKHDNEIVQKCRCNGSETVLYFNLKQHAYLLLCLEPTSILRNTPIGHGEEPNCR